MKNKKHTLKKSSASPSSTRKNKTAASAGGKKVAKVKRASKKILSAANYVKTATKKLIDDVFLKVVGNRALERAEEMTQSLRKEKVSKKGLR
jgi:hypothetical protein